MDDNNTLIKKKNRINRIKKIFGCICFIILLGLWISKLSWSFRANKMESREDVVGLNTVQGDIDVITIGSSNMIRYYMPICAYEEYGYTSYNFATSSAEMDVLRFYIEEAEKHQSPQLYVVNVGCLLYMKPEVRESAIRNWTDSLEIWNPTRVKSILYYLSGREIEQNTDILSLFFDLAKYHSDAEVLGNPKQYRVHKNSFNNIDKGFKPYTNVQPYKQPAVVSTKGYLSKQENRALVDLIQYCKKEKLNVLFIASPAVIDETEWEKLNAAEHIIVENGFTFLNMNRCYEEIGLDFETDFSNKGHVNYLGAIKFSDYFATYLKEHYALPDHRGDEDYLQWDTDVCDFETLQAEWIKDNEEEKNKIVDGKHKGMLLSQEYDFDKWINEIWNDNYSVIIYCGNALSLDSKICEVLSEKMGGKDLIKNHMAFLYNRSMGVYMWPDENGIIKGNIGSENDTSIYISVDNEPSIMINGIEYINDGSEGELHVVVFDNYYSKVYDSVTVVDKGQDTIKMER